jgi:hypothetical protein
MICGTESDSAGSRRARRRLTSEVPLLAPERDDEEETDEELAIIEQNGE